MFEGRTKIAQGCAVVVAVAAYCLWPEDKAEYAGSETVHSGKMPPLDLASMDAPSATSSVDFSREALRQEVERHQTSAQSLPEPFPDVKTTFQLLDRNTNRPISGISIGLRPVVPDDIDQFSFRPDLRWSGETDQDGKWTFLIEAGRISQAEALWHIQAERDQELQLGRYWIDVNAPGYFWDGTKANRFEIDIQEGHSPSLQQLYLSRGSDIVVNVVNGADLTPVVGCNVGYEYRYIQDSDSSRSILFNEYTDRSGKVVLTGAPYSTDDYLVNLNVDHPKGFLSAAQRIEDLSSPFEAKLIPLREVQLLMTDKKSALPLADEIKKPLRFIAIISHPIVDLNGAPDKEGNWTRTSLSFTIPDGRSTVTVPLCPSVAESWPPELISLCSVTIKPEIGKRYKKVTLNMNEFIEAVSTGIAVEVPLSNSD